MRLGKIVAVEFGLITQSDWQDGSSFEPVV
jgi:hypothetical protein